MKNWITNGISADYYIVVTQTDKEKAHRGITAFLVGKGTPGFGHGVKEDKLGIRSSDTCSLTFENCKVPEENIIWEIGKGVQFCNEYIERRKNRYCISSCWNCRRIS